MDNSVFISYRRDVSAYIARAVFQDLRANGIDAFMDVQSIDSGQFDTAILNQIAARPYFLLVLTPGTLERCAEQGDWLLREMERAISLKRVIIPLVTPTFSFEDAKKFLTDPLATELPRFNAVTVPHDYFEEAMTRLRTRFLKPTDLPIAPIPKPDEIIVQAKIAQIAAETPVTKQQLSAQAQFEQGLARPAKNLSDKIKDYTEAIRLNPTDANIYYRRGIALQYKGEYEKAFADYDEAIRLDPQNANVYVARGTAKGDQGNSEGMLTDYSTAIRLNPRNVEAFNLRAAYYYDQGEFLKAVADFGELIRLNPTSGNYNNRAESYFALWQYQQALDDFENAVKLDRNSPYAIAGVAISKHALGQNQEAYQIWRTLIEKNMRFQDADWVGKELSWQIQLIEQARKLIGEL